MSVKNDINILLQKAKIIHNDNFDYSLISDYKNMNQIQTIICKKHNYYINISLHSHINKKRGCKLCAIDNRMDNDDIFIKKSNIVHNYKYDYSLIEYINSKTKVKIICPLHGIFKQKPNDHLNGKGCPICKLSKGEKEIKKYLDINNIKYEQQKPFNGCKFKKPLKFDFYLPDHNICIEFNGEQHYKPFKYFGGKESFKNIQKRDMIKESFCKENNLILIKIKYNDDITKILNTII